MLGMDSLNVGNHVRVKSESPLEFNSGDSFSKFALKFKDYVTLCRVTNPNLNLYLLSCIKCEETWEKLRDLTLSNDEKANVDLLLKRFGDEMYPYEFSWAIRAELFSLTQLEHETIEKFCFRINELARKAVFENTMQRDVTCLQALISGIRDTKIKKEIIKQNPSNYKLASSIAVKLEKVEIGIDMLNSNDNGQMNTISNNTHRSRWSDQFNYNIGSERSTHMSSNNTGQNFNYRRVYNQRNACFNCGDFYHAYRDCPQLINRYNTIRNNNYKNCGYNSRGGFSSRWNNNLNGQHFGRRNTKMRFGNRPNNFNNHGQNKWQLNRVQNNKDSRMVVKGNCAGQPVHYFLDTGSSVSIISISFVKFMNLNDKIRPCHNKLTSFSGNSIKIFGEIPLPFSVAGLELGHTFIVSEFNDAEILMGMDIISEYGINIDSRKRQIYSPFGSAAFRDPPKPVTSCMKIVSKNTVTIPPMSGTHISGKFIGAPGYKGDFYGQIEPYINTTLSTGLLTAQALVNSRDGIVPIRVLNATDQPITLNKRTLMGRLMPVELGEKVMSITKSEDPNSQNINNHNNRDIIQEAEDLVRAGLNNNYKWESREQLFKQIGIGDLKISDLEKRRMEDVCWKYRSVFSTCEEDIGNCNFYEAELELKENYKAKWVPSRKIPYKLEGEMDRQIASLIKSEAVERCKYHSNFNSPVFLVPKGSQDQWRLVCDLRLVNLETKDDCMELPNINHILDRVGDKNLYSTVDLSKSFHQIPYSESSKHITAFMYKGKQYNFARMVMGQKGSSAKFTRMMQILLASLPIEHVAYFIDDLILFTRDVSSHIDLLEMLFERLQQGNLKLTPKKCHFMREEVTYVGVTLTKDGIKINDERVEAIKVLKPPINAHEVQSVLGIFNYSKQFIKNYSKISKPLYHLIRKNSKFIWTEECARAFEELKNAMITAPVLAFPDIEDPHSSYEVELDGSKYAYGATLTQFIKGKRRVVAYFSRKIQDHKGIWPQTQLEFETLFQTLKHFKQYLRGAKHFVVITDCLPLLNITTIFSKMSTSVIRKLQELANYKFTIRHKSGVEMECADALSRYGYQNFKRNPNPNSSLNNSDINYTANKNISDTINTYRHL